ncbi:MAG TPA: bZIP transcription factor [Candidatus Omnitrophota bacterium]|nr:bZIP transcription factor [Candidatus Omnitrophota bacterium]HPN55870.1 bZIP transcription factor [Candidatus Omnitrophota bacterium]
MKRAGRSCFVVLLVAVFLTAFPLTGETSDDVIRELSERFDKLEQENTDLKAEVKRLNEKIEGVEGETRNLKALSGSPVADMQPVTHKTPFDIGMYGFIKTDLIYNDSQSGEDGVSAPSESEGARDDNEFMFNVRDTRIGFDFSGPAVFEDGKAKGKIEFDFYGSSDDHSLVSYPRFRKVYAQFVFPSWNVLAGQTDDFFSPLNADMLSTNDMRRTGNIGYRHPQVVLTNTWPGFGEDTLKTQLGMLETTDLNADTGSPDFAGYITYGTKILDRPFQIGAGGLCGRQNTSDTVDRNVDIWAVTGHITYDITRELSLKMEGFQGAGLTNYRGIGPTEVSNSSDDKAKSLMGAGGWLQLSYKPRESKWEFINGIGKEDVVTMLSSLDTSTWDYNFSNYHSVAYNLTDNLYLGLEFQRIITKYKQKDGGDLSRVMTSVVYSF